MAHYESNCSVPSDYCHPALPCATKPLNSVLLVKTFSLNSGQFIIISAEEEYILIFVTNSLPVVQIKGDGRGLTSGTISGGSSGVSDTRQLATTKPLRHQPQYFFKKTKKFLVGLLEKEERESSIRLPPDWSGRCLVVTSAGRGPVSPQLSTYFGNNRNSQQPLIGAQRHFKLQPQYVLSKAQFPSHFSLSENSTKGCNWSSLSQWQPAAPLMSLLGLSQYYHLI